MSAGVTTTHDKYPPFSRAELQAVRDRAEWIGAQLIDPHAARAHLDLAQAADHMDAIYARDRAAPDLKLYDPNADTELYAPPPAPDGFAGGGAAVPAPEGGPESDEARAEREAALSAPPRTMPASEVRPKPPLGAYPRKLWNEQRREHLLAAVERFQQAQRATPPELFDELRELDRLLNAPEPAFTSAGPGLRVSLAAVPSELAAAMRDALADQRTGEWVAVPEAPDDSDPIFQNIAKRTRGRIVDRIARRHIATYTAVEAALDEATKDRPLWQWLRDGGLEKLIALVVSLLPLFV